MAACQSKAIECDSSRPPHALVIQTGSKIDGMFKRLHAFSELQVAHLLRIC